MEGMEGMEGHGGMDRWRGWRVMKSHRGMEGMEGWGGWRDGGIEGIEGMEGMGGMEGHEGLVRPHLFLAQLHHSPQTPPPAEPGSSRVPACRSHPQNPGERTAATTHWSRRTCQ